MPAKVHYAGESGAQACSQQSNSHGQTPGETMDVTCQLCRWTQEYPRDRNRAEQAANAQPPATQQD